MTTITITRLFSGFQNVEDRFALGDLEHDGNAAAGRYVMPAGYSVDTGLIRDPAGIECAIVDDGNGRPMLVSRAGMHADVVLVDAA